MDYEDAFQTRNIMRDLGQRGVTVKVHGAASVSSPTNDSWSRSVGSDPVEPQPLTPSLPRDRHFQQSMRHDEAVRAFYASATTTPPSVDAASSRGNHISNPSRTTAADTAAAGSTCALKEVHGGSLSSRELMDDRAYRDRERSPSTPDAPAEREMERLSGSRDGLPFPTPATSDTPTPRTPKTPGESNSAGSQDRGCASGFCWVLKKLRVFLFPNIAAAPHFPLNDLDI
mmetsp:Transcript_29141/g.84250  ORF Transcript_29141/g.84250 Transcript_29141/m.84250 type:complete len:229 (-) Transcript_29141:563-1249(-)